MSSRIVNLSKLAQASDIPPSIVSQRVHRLGWSLNAALSTPVGSKPNGKGKKKVVGSVPRKSKATTKKPSSSILDEQIRAAEEDILVTKDRIAELEEELRKAGRRCKLAQVAALAVIVAVTMWAVNP